MFHREKNNGNFRSTMLGFLAGGIIGSVTALMYAPKSGRVLRRQIKHKSDALIKDAEAYLSDAKAKTQEMIRKAEREIEKIYSLSKKQVRDTAAHLKTAVRPETHQAENS